MLLSLGSWLLEDDSAGAIPGPIPSPEVKPCNADDTTRVHRLEACATDCVGEDAAGDNFIAAAPPLDGGGGFYH